jgi:hypothetical protein
MAKKIIIGQSEWTIKDAMPRPSSVRSATR